MDVKILSFLADSLVWVVARRSLVPDTLTTSHRTQGFHFIFFVRRSLHVLTYSIPCTCIYINRNVTYIFFCFHSPLLLFSTHSTVYKKKFRHKYFLLVDGVFFYFFFFRTFRFGQCNAIPLNLKDCCLHVFHSKLIKLSI